MLAIDGRAAFRQEQPHPTVGTARMTQLRRLRIYAARSECGDVCSIETVRRVLLCLLVNRTRVLFASLRRAHRNASMNKAAVPQALTNAMGAIT